MEFEDLSVDNILTEENIDSLFVDNEPEDTSSEGDDNKDNKTTEEIDPDNLFDTPESVGSEDDNTEDTGEEDPLSTKGSSPKNFFSSVAHTLVETGVFQNLDSDFIKNIKSPEDFEEAINKQIQLRFDERQKRIDDALNANIEPSEIKKYENVISNLNNITEEAITDESDRGENLRKQLILQDYLNRGFSKERAQREVKKSMDAASDIEDAKAALESNKEYFTTAYKELIDEAKSKEAKEIENRKETSEKLRKSILEDNKVFGDITIDNSTRQKIYDNISKPIGTNPETGEPITALQKYQLENKIDFLKNFGLLFTLTDGFKNIDKLVKSKVNKEVKEKYKELEHTINSTARTSSGTLKFASGVEDDPDSFSSPWSLDI